MLLLLLLRVVGSEVARSVEVKSEDATVKSEDATVKNARGDDDEDEHRQRLKERVTGIDPLAVVAAAVVVVVVVAAEPRY